MTDSRQSPGLTLALAAEGLVGARYRLHGRDPASGLDCIGLLAAALARIGRTARLPNGYALRSLAAPGIEPAALRLGFAPVGSPDQPGDVAFVRVCPGQFHLAIAGAARGFVHAHAGLRRVVLTPTLGDWRLESAWRLAPN